jgi:hypothetical protein
MKLPLLTVVFCFCLPIYCQQTTKSATGVRLQYMVLNDTSERTLWPGGIEQQANTAARFLKEVVNPGSDVGTLVNFSEEFWLDAENSTNPDDIAAKLVRRGHHATALYQAVVSAAQWLAKQESSDRHKIIFVFSDGDDNASQISLEDTIAAVHRVHIPVSVIAPSAVEHKRPGKAMKQLANATGGHVYFVHHSDNFDFGALKRDLTR